MPITRSRTGRDSRSVQATHQPTELVSSAGPSEQQTASTTDATPSQYTTESSNTTETTGASIMYSSNMTSTDSATDATARTTSGETNLEKQTPSGFEANAIIITRKNTLSIPPINSHTTVGGAPPQRSNKSRKSQKSTRLSQAKEELLRLQIELAAARIATIEAETDTEDDDNDTITTNQETTQRVNDWLNESHSGALNPQRKIEGKIVPQEQKAPRFSTIPQIDDAAKQKPAPTREPAEVAIPIEQKQIDIRELASAIALAARAGQNTMPRHYIELPTYGGAYQEWLSFRAAYMETVNSYSEYENIARLRRSLRGRAKEAVENLLIYSTSPEEIMKTLESRFGRPDAIALAELERLRALPRPSDTPRDVCIFATKVSNIVATLRALQKTHYLYNPEVIKATIEKLTPAMRYRWFDFAADNQTEEADLLRLARFLQRESDRCGPYAQPESIIETAGHSSIQRRSTAKAYATTTPQSAQLECPICGKQGHNARACPKLLEADISDRWDIAKNKSLCFRCLKHRTRKHSCRGKPCELEGCTRLHHRLLHFPKKTEEKEIEVVTSTWTRSQSFLKIVPVRVSGPKGDVSTYALLDDGSTVTLIDREIAQQIGARGPLDPLHVEGIGSNSVNASTSRRVTLTLHGTKGSHNITARTFDQLQLTAQRITENHLIGCNHIRDIADQLKYRKAKPKLLIGQDNWHLLLATDVRRGQRDQPVASLTPLGWVLHGAHTRALGQRVHYINNLIEIDRSLDEQLKRHFALDSLTIEPKRPHNDLEERALALLKKHTKQRVDGRYETALLWKNEDVVMPDNYENAYKRLLNTERKIDKDPILKQTYERQMNALIEKGYAEHAPSNSVQNKTWYLPHFPVLNPMKPGKVRIVHDAAAKTKGMSLNDYLLTGPDLLQSLPGVLMRFRQYPVAVTADIAEMFMQVKIRPEDRDALRYLWRGSERGDYPPKQYRMTSLIFGATSSPATAIFVKNENARKQKDVNPNTYEAIIRNHYVDDYLQSFETQENSNVNEWRWIPSRLNVADDATRDVPRDLTTEHRWFRGPSFLREEPSSWPQETSTTTIQTGEEKNQIVSEKIHIVAEKTISLRDCLPEHSRFSRWERLLRSTARVLQFIEFCRLKKETVHYKRNKKTAEKDPTWRRVAPKNVATIKTPRTRNNASIYACIDAAILEKAEHLLIRFSQEESFAAELKNLHRGEKVAKNSRLWPLATEKVKGVITLATRIDAATGINDRMKKPPVLDGNHNIARLYIEYVHRQLHHAGVETTVNECRQHMWILRLRPTTRSIIRRCLLCIKRRSIPPTPPTGNHPYCRLAHHLRPFTHTGLDYFGPLTVTVGRTHQKRYVALFTCLTTRAIHLEIAASLSTDAAVMAFRRMIARRGCPSEIWSDNGTNLQGAAKELRRTLDKATAEEASKRAVAWRFIPPGAPFMGGAWERLVRSVKIALETAMRERHPTEEVFSTLLAEAEYTVNSRPLTHVSVSTEDPEALTPNHFLLGGSARTPTPGTFSDADLIGRTHWRASQRLADIFWSRWLKEYLPSLQYRREPHGKGLSIQTGNIVLIADGTLPRNTWPRGIVTAVYPGPDGIVRTVDVRTKGGTLRRPTRKLIVLPTESPALPAESSCVDHGDGARRE